MGLASGPEILGFDAKRPKKNRRRDWLAAGRPCLLPGETRWGLGSDYLRVFLDLAGHDPLDVLDSVAVDAQLRARAASSSACAGESRHGPVRTGVR